MTLLDDIHEEGRRQGIQILQTDERVLARLGMWLIDNHFPQAESDATRCQMRTNSVKQFVKEVYG